ncbi:MAG: hypothetical protein OXI51_10230 [Chloroflexota bacterium]|nr:hypothetical protein [Chloroflexota bacterium]
MISGYFSAKWGCPFVWVRLTVPGRPPQPIPFLIDTGSATSIVHAKDARTRLDLAVSGLDPAAWPPGEIVRRRGVAGVALSRPMNAVFNFVHEDGTAETIAGTVELGALNTEHLPSLLGWDVLRHFRLDLNASRGSVALLPP